MTQEERDFLDLFQQLLEESLADNICVGDLACHGGLRREQVAVRHRFGTSVRDSNADSFQCWLNLQAVDETEGNDLVKIPWRSIVQFVIA